MSKLLIAKIGALTLVLASTVAFTPSVQDTTEIDDSTVQGYIIQDVHKPYLYSKEVTETLSEPNSPTSEVAEPVNVVMPKSFEEIVKDAIITINPHVSEELALNVSLSVIRYIQYYKSVPLEEVLALIDIESDFNPKCEGYSADRGLMQIIPSTEQYIAEHIGIEDYNIYDIDTNIRFGMWYMNDVREKYGKYAYIVYNQGLKKPLTEELYDYHVSTETTYLSKVMRLSEKYREEINKNE